MIGLREVRKNRGITQTELASLVKWADPTADQVLISTLERGEIYPSEKLCAALCEAMDCTEKDLYNGIEAMFVNPHGDEISETTMRLAEVIVFGAENAISRTELRMMTGWSDRVLRRNIQKAREEGMVICNSQDGKGYYRPTTKQEYIAQYKSNQSRALSILRQQKFLRFRIIDGDDDET